MVWHAQSDIGWNKICTGDLRGEEIFYSRVLRTERWNSKNYSHYIHNWLVTPEIDLTPWNFLLLGLRASGTMHWGPCLELLGFCPPLGQFNGLQWKWLQSFAPFASLCGGWRNIPSLFGMPVVLAVAVSFNNLVLRVGTMVMQCEYCTKKSLPSF